MVTRSKALSLLAFLVGLTWFNQVGDILTWYSCFAGMASPTTNDCSGLSDRMLEDIIFFFWVRCEREGLRNSVESKLVIGYRSRSQEAEVLKFQIQQTIFVNQEGPERQLQAQRET